MSQVATNPASHGGFGPLRELLATVGALSELGAVLDPLRLVAGALRGRGAGVEGVVEAAQASPTRPPRAAPVTPVSTEVRPAETPIPSAASSPAPATVTATAAAAAAVRAGAGAAGGRAGELLRSLRRPGNIAFAVALIAVLTAWWVELRPTAFLGGPATFVTVKGVSMLPTLKTGDFVLAEAQPSYKVGDLVVYRVPKGQIGAGDDLIHRIVAGNATTGFTLKGDNNPAPDPWTVPRSDVLGKEAVVIPGFGSTLLVLRSPLFAGLVAALIAMWVVLSPPEWLRGRKPAAAAAVTPSAGAAGTGHTAAALAPVEEPVAAAAAPDPSVPAGGTPPARRRSRTPAKPAKPALPTARPAPRARPAGRSRPPRREL
jgi:signal peptidase I